MLQFEPGELLLLEGRSLPHLRQRVLVPTRRVRLVPVT